MKHVKKSVLLWYSPREMYDLVVNVRDYPAFLPWCARAEVLTDAGEEMTARLHLAYAGVKHAFTTRNTHVDGESVLMHLVDGPFSVLEGQWRFIPLGTPAASAALEAVVSPVFDRIANTFVDAFVDRAAQVHGPR